MGLGDAVSQILAKDVAAPDPVLAKRKTALMKELEVDQKQEQKKKKLREEAIARRPSQIQQRQLREQSQHLRRAARDDVGFSAEGARAAEFFGLVDRRSVDEEEEDEWEY